MTIVVLLILAGITIVYVFGDNGVFGRAQEAKDRTEQAKQDEQDYFGNVDNTINKYANGNGGGSGNGGTNPDNPNPSEPEGPTISDSSSTSHTATTIDYTWEQISKIAEAIAKSDSVNSDTMEVKVNVDGTECTIGVGDIAKVKYQESETSEVEKRVRVLGFKHDDLVNTGVYGGNHTKAGISFEFYDFMTGNTYMSMNASNDNTGGWAATQMRKDLNGYTTNNDEQSGAIGGLGAKLSNQGYIKQVKKSYIKEYGNANSIYQDNDSSKGKHYTQDYLWLLACSEVLKDGYQANAYGYAITTEGSQYKYYQGVTEAWNTNSTGRTKYNASGAAYAWWLRSPPYNHAGCFCNVSYNRQ